ncbi:MAG: helix-turn-helix domain-containing protein [Clostridia bacterium]|nr:helix-turn-helix domain-containing protein [Clostridia bacterium]
MQTLQVLIDMLTKGRKLHISILDISGILNTPLTKISVENVIHSKKFCDIAKSTEKGYRLCLRCKKLANAKAIKYKKPFCEHCLYGLCEAAMPVIIDNAVAAVVYVGNAIIDTDKTCRRIDKACHYTNVDPQMLYEQTKECERLDNEKELLKISEIVCDYIKMLYIEEPKAPTSMHWLVLALKRYADLMYCTNPTLKGLSAIYHKNEKYMGRLFIKEMHMSFHEYCLLLKLQKAEGLLLRTKDKIIDIALECGFDNISYFNRAFKKQYGMSPSEYITSRGDNK